jgi:hypothetical protein
VAFGGADLIEQLTGLEIAQEDFQIEGGDVDDLVEQRVLLIGQLDKGSNFQHCEDSFPRQNGSNDNCSRGHFYKFRDGGDVIRRDVREGDRLLFLCALADDALAHGKRPVEVMSLWVAVTANEAEALSSIIQQEERPAQSLQRGDQLRHQAPRKFLRRVSGLKDAGDFGEDGLGAALRFALVGGAAVGLEGAGHLTDFGLVLLVGDSNARLVGEEVAEAFIERGEGIDDAFAVEEEQGADDGGYRDEQCGQSDVGE